jgi:ADP-ribosylglycohydrolase
MNEIKNVSSPVIDWINRHECLTGCDLVTEYAQARDEGRDLRTVEKVFNRLNKADGKGKAVGGERDERWVAEALALIDRVQTLPFRKDYPYVEPSDLPGIRMARPARPALKPWRGGRAEFERRLHGGWLGRICGCLLGKPVEGASRSDIRIWGEATRNWPLKGYFREPTPAQLKAMEANGFKRKLGARLRPMLAGQIRGMVEDDDTNYTVIGFGIVKQWGAAFTPADVATCWMNNVPVLHTFTAERAAYRNFVANVVPPRSASFRNPYREWIGAQIRADYFGYANPGDPERAAEWAWRDASISHVKNGIYGEMWVAAMLAAAYVETDWARIIRAGLAQVPAKCRLREEVEKVLAMRAAGVTYAEAADRIHAQWNEGVGHHWCHTNSNAQIVALGLLYGDNDFEKTIAGAVMPGFDTDCNGATCGSLWGVRNGVDKVPGKWARPMRDTIHTGVDGYHKARIGNLAAEMAEVAMRNR